MLNGNELIKVTQNANLSLFNLNKNFPHPLDRDYLDCALASYKNEKNRQSK
jgi:hypothetical protein